MRTEWTDERVAALKLWWSEGSTGEAIAARLGGVSRSAVLGKIFRLRLAATAAVETEAAPAAARDVVPEAVADVSSPHRCRRHRRRRSRRRAARAARVSLN